MVAPTGMASQDVWKVWDFGYILKPLLAWSMTCMWNDEKKRIVKADFNIFGLNSVYTCAQCYIYPVKGEQLSWEER